MTSMKPISFAVYHGYFVEESFNFIEVMKIYVVCRVYSIHSSSSLDVKVLGAVWIGNHNVLSFLFLDGPEN